MDIAALLDVERLEQAVAEAQVRRLVTEPELRAQLKCGKGRPGTSALRGLLDRLAPPALTKTRAERLMLRLIRSGDLPEPLVNARLGRFYPDFYWPDRRVVAEFDSYGFHTDIAAFRRDREKSNALQLMGITVLRFTWDDVTRRPAALESRLRQALGIA